MHAALSPLKIDGSVGGAAFFYRTLGGDTSAYDLNKMIMLETSVAGAASAGMQYPTGTYQRLACSGHSFLRDGRLFIAGGQFHGGLANDDAYIWRDLPLTQNTLQATSSDNKMCGQPADIPTPGCVASLITGYTGNRWYPTTIPLWDGQIMVIGGAAESSRETWNNSYEFYIPGSPPPGSSLGSFDCNPTYRVKDSAGNNICEFSKTCEVCWDYPHYHAIPEGLFLAGQLHATRLFRYSKLEENPKELRATADPNQPYLHRETRARVDSASVMLEIKLDQQAYNQTSRVLLVGGYGDAGPPIQHLDTAELFDAQAGAWRWTACVPPLPPDCAAPTRMRKVRQYPKTVLLPNNRVLIVGGEGNPILGGESHPGEKSSELFDPTDETFGSPLAMDPNDPTKNRRYHSQAFLLPDGRVITAGDDFVTNQFPDPGINGDVNGATYNVYYPTYMSQARPTIISTSATTIAWGVPFEICASGISGSDFDSVILVRPSSTTHVVDFDHRQVQLQVTPGGTCSGVFKITVTLPANPVWEKHVLPPGYYMLIVRKAGNPPIPSVAKFVQLCPVGGCV